MARDALTEDIRSRTDIVELVGQYVALRPAGGERFKACCPFHEEKTPSFYVSRGQGFYKCFGCGVAGDVFKFLQQIENITFPEARRQLAARCGVPLEGFGRDLTPEQQAQLDERDKQLKLLAAAATFFREQFAGGGGALARDYARARGLTPPTLEKFGIGYAPDSWDALGRWLVNRHNFTPAEAAACGLVVARQPEAGRGEGFYDRFRHRLMFPIWNRQGQVIAFGGRALEGGHTGNPDAKYLNSPEGPLFKKSEVLYGWHLARAEAGRAANVIVTEGYMDTIALHEAGFGNTLASLGTALTSQHASALARLGAPRVFLCFDGDSAGLRAALRSGGLFATHQLDVRVVVLPPGQDPDTLVRGSGREAFNTLLEEARPPAQFRLEQSLQDVDLTQAGNRREALRQALAIIAEVPSESERQELVRVLSSRWVYAGGGAGDMTVSATERRQEIFERSITSEIENLIHGQQRGEGARPVADRLESELHDAAPPLTGVARAERALLATILTNLVWRSLILRELTPEQWTEPVHREIVTLLQAAGEADGASIATWLENLTPEAGELAGRLMLSDPERVANEERTVRGLMKRVQDYWTGQHEARLLHLVRDKLDRGLEVSAEEKAALRAALAATGRNKSPEKKK